MKIRLSAAALMCVAASMIAAAPAAATSVANTAFDVHGDLNTFPCPTGCTAGFSGFADGVQTAHGTLYGQAYDAVINYNNAPINGQAVYIEPGGNLCGLTGSADNPATVQMTIQANANQAAGVIQRESTPTLGGVVNGVTVTMKFHYTRVGTVALVTILGGSVTVNFFYPDIGQQSITENITEGEAPAVFDVNPLDVASACTAGSGKLHFDLIGDATLTSA